MDKENRRILILDDDLDNLQLTKDALQFAGFETYDFFSPQLVLELYKQNPQLYDLVLVDVKMEEMDGRVVYKKLKELKRDAKVYVFTALELDSNEFKQICPSFQEQHLIRKPIRMDLLIEKVRQAVK